MRLKMAVKRAEIKLSALFAEHNIAFNAAEHLEDLLKSCFNQGPRTKRNAWRTFWGVRNTSPPFHDSFRFNE